jgi:DNA mismatch endonuclease, patch repair protein
MSRIKSSDTRPEMQVRSLLHRLGYRYALHRRDLPGVPDLVFPSGRKIVLVQGCFYPGRFLNPGDGSAHSELHLELPWHRLALPSAGL